MVGGGRYLSLPQQLQRCAGDHLCPQPQCHLQAEEDLGQSLQTGLFLGLNPKNIYHLAVYLQMDFISRVFKPVCFADKVSHGPAPENSVIRGKVQESPRDAEKVNTALCSEYTHFISVLTA